MSQYQWHTVMHRDDEPDHQGQAAANVLADGRLELTVMASPGTFATRCVITREEREALRDWLMASA